jgi:hypothetical protein
MGSSKLKVKHFHSEPIEVIFSSPPARKKSPPCPGGFKWQNKTFQISRCLSEWKEFGRCGKMAHNMQPQHAEAASQHGSWGVGRFYFEVETMSGHFFRIYYDRAPKDAFDRDGQWILMAELSPEVE